MTWRTSTVTQQRSEFLALARLPDSNISELCRRFGISRKTAYKWLKRDSTEDRASSRSGIYARHCEWDLSGINA